MIAYYEKQRQELEARVASGEIKKIIAANGILYLSTSENGQETGYAASTPELVIMTSDMIELNNNVPDEQFVGRSRIINGSSQAIAIVKGFIIRNSSEGQPIIDFASLTDTKNQLPKTLGFPDVISNLTAIQGQKQSSINKIK